jgi:hypothetical protein
MLLNYLFQNFIATFLSLNLFLILQLINFEDAAVVAIIFLFSINIYIYIRNIHREKFLSSCGDITSVTLVFFALYTIVPIFVYLTKQHYLTPMAWYGNNDELFLKVLCYHLLFSISMQLPSLLKVSKPVYSVALPLLDNRQIKFLFIVTFLITLISIFILSLLSGPIETYYDHYTRYDHHTGIARSLVSILIRTYIGLQPFIILFAIILFKDKPIRLILFIGFLCAIDLSYSQGSRIQSFMIVVQAICLYTLIARAISFRVMSSVAFMMVLALTIVEVVRISSGGVSGLTIESIGIAYEFLALFIPELHLFGLAAKSQLPAIDSIMIFKDLIELIPFVSVQNADPMIWYWNEFHPDAQVAPYTLGPISDSAWSGGLFGIVIRGVLIGLVLASLVRLLSFNISWWLKLSAYSYAVSTSILTLKYGVFTIYSHLLFNWTIGIIIVAIILMIYGIFFKGWIKGK